MKKALPFLLIMMLGVSALAFHQRSASSSDLELMVSTERAFAQRAAERGTRDAFLAFMSDESIVFAPGPVNGKKSWGERPARPGLLSWQPSYADISQAGDMGYDMGPWEFRPGGPADKPVAFGHFMTIWKKQQDGTFKFALDLGISHSQHPSPPTLQYSNVKTKATKNASASEIDAGRALILSTEREFASASASRGTLKAYLSFMADEVRLLHEGKYPFIGRAAAEGELQSRAGSMSWQPDKGDVSRSLDIGYTYGSYQWKSSEGKLDESGYYVHVWKRGPSGKWKLVMEVLNPTPKKSS